MTQKKAATPKKSKNTIVPDLFLKIVSKDADFEQYDSEADYILEGTDPRLLLSQGFGILEKMNVDAKLLVVSKYWLSVIEQWEDSVGLINKDSYSDTFFSNVFAMKKKAITPLFLLWEAYVLENKKFRKTVAKLIGSIKTKRQNVTIVSVQLLLKEETGEF